MEVNKKLKYNFVLFFAREDFWRAILGEELYDGEYIHIYRHAFNSNKILEKIFHYHWSYNINRRIRLPFKRIWFRKMYNQNFNNNLPICFMFMGGNNVIYDAGFTKYVKKKNPKNKIVIIHNDLISEKIKYDYELLRNKADICTSYDLNDAKKHNICYFQETTYSKLIPEPENVQFDYDVYFLGAAKDRLPKILEVLHYLVESGVKCKFFVAGVPMEKRKDEEGLEYIDNISYVENLNYVIKSKCVLELIQGGSCDITTRALEAIAYRRKLITDCQIIDKKLFNINQLAIINDSNDIDIDWVKEDYKPNKYEPVIDLNPMKRFYFIQEQLEKIDEK